MRLKWAMVAALCLGSFEAEAQKVSTMQPAQTPLSGTELLYCVQAGQSRECIVNDLALLAAGAGLAHASNNLQLSSLASTFTTVLRTGFAQNGDAPPQLYIASTGPCSLNGGTGDGGSQVPTSDGNCWMFVPSTGGVSVAEWTGTPSGDVSTALNAAATAAQAAGVPLIFPGGTFEVCAHSFAPPNGSDIYGQVNLTRIQTQPGCVSPPYTVTLPTAAPVNPSLVWGSMHNLIIDGFGLSQYVLFGQFTSQWSFHSITVRNAKPATVTTAVTNAATAAGSAILTFASPQNVTNDQSGIQNATIVDDLSRSGIIPPGDLVKSCSPSCAAATSITLDRAVTAWDDGSGVASGDTIRFIAPTADVALLSGYGLDFTDNFNTQNINDTGHTLYTSQTTLPAVCMYLAAAGGFSSLSDSLFDGSQFVNCMYGVLDPYGLGNSFGKHTHAWGQAVVTGQTFDLRIQYGFAIGGADWITDWDVDDGLIAAVYAGLSGIGGVPASLIRGGNINYTSTPTASNIGILLAYNLLHGVIKDNRAIGLSANNLKQNIVYQRGVAGQDTIVRDNDDTLYSTSPTVFRGVSPTAALSTTATFLGPVAADPNAGNQFVVTCPGYLTGYRVDLSQGTALTQNVTFNLTNESGDLAGTSQTLATGQFAIGQAGPPTSAKMLLSSGAPILAAAGDQLVIKAVLASGTATANFSYAIYETCTQGN